MPLGGISTIDKYSIIKGFKETCFISLEIYKFITPYILFIKIILNFYSKIQVPKNKYVNVNFKDLI